MERLKQITDEEYLQCLDTNRMLLEDFLTNSTELSERSLISYSSNLRIWLVWVKENLENKCQVDIKPREYLRYQNFLLNKGHSSSDISNKRAAISSFNNYIVTYYSDEYPTFHNFINKSIKKPEKSFVHDKIPPTRDELEMMVQKLEKSDIKNKYQYIAYLKFTFETGCRRAETRQLMRDIVNTPITIKQVRSRDETGNITSKEAKYYLTPKIRCKGKGRTGKVRQLKFSDYSMAALKKWVSVREDDCPYMFVTFFQGKWKQVALQTFNDWSVRIFTPLLGRRFHPHILRESAATDIVLTQGKSIEAAKALLGHESSETTRIYVCGIDEGEEADELFIDD